MKLRLVVLLALILTGSCSKSENDVEIIEENPTEEIPTEENPSEENPTEENPTDTGEAPTFIAGEDPKPDGKTWEKVAILSDEFDGNSLDTDKWASKVNSWVGRAPGIFKDEAISFENGNLLITNYMLEATETINGNTYTHGGGLIRSINAAAPGMYFECRMKANKTFMSSTFWLINTRNEGTGCDRRTTELDIQECVGEITTSANWASTFNRGMHSNTHSRNAECAETNEGSKGNTTVADIVYEDYHVYAAWWKSPTEILFFLDGELQKIVNPVEEFSLPMYYRLVTETYDWNPVPTDGGLTGSFEDRTTKYDWVRTWKLIDN